MYIQRKKNNRMACLMVTDSKICHLVTLIEVLIHPFFSAWVPDLMQWSSSLRFPIQTHYPLDSTFWSEEQCTFAPICCHLPGLCSLITLSFQVWQSPQIWLNPSVLWPRWLSTSQLLLSISVQIPADSSFALVQPEWVRQNIRIMKFTSKCI